jgi:hypothetical protein
LQLGVVGAAVDGSLLQDLGGDLADALVADPFLGRDFVIGEALAQPGEDAKIMPCALIRRRRAGGASSTMPNSPYAARSDGNTSQNSMLSVSNKDNVAAISFFQ